MKKIHVAFLILLLCIATLEGAVLIYQAATAEVESAAETEAVSDTAQEKETAPEDAKDTAQTETETETKTAAAHETTTINVLLLDAQGAQQHTSPGFTSDGEWTLDNAQGTCVSYTAGSQVTWEEIQQTFSSAEDGTMPEQITITGDGEHGICILSGGESSREYFGILRLYPSDGVVTIVNEVDIEQYLCGVLPSEMPKSFETEALKAQAICARSYAYAQMLSYEYPQYNAQIDDSVSFQVYNKQPTSKKAKAAVAETEGIVLTYGDAVAEPFYFSTSWGMTSGVDIWGEENKDYPYLQPVAVSSHAVSADYSKEKNFQKAIQKTNADDLEAECKYYRWHATISMNKNTGGVSSILAEKSQSSPETVTFYDTDGEPLDTITGFGKIMAVSVTERNTSGAAAELAITFENGKALITNEYTIRQLMAQMVTDISYHDGSSEEGRSLLPSAYFAIIGQTETSNGILYGGGLGHGIGMSQYGANALAKNGYGYKAILRFFYQDITLKRIEDLK